MYTRCIYCILTSAKLPPKWERWLRHNDMMRVGLGRSTSFQQGRKPQSPQRQQTRTSNAACTKHLAPSKANTWRPALGRVWSGLSNLVCHQRLQYVHAYTYTYGSTSGYTYIVYLYCIPYGYNCRCGSHSYSHLSSYVFFYLSPYSYVIILFWRSGNTCINLFSTMGIMSRHCCCLLERQPKGFTNLIQSVSPHHSHSQECLAAQYAAPARGVLKW